MDPIAIIERSYEPRTDLRRWVESMARDVMQAFDPDDLGTMTYFLTPAGELRDVRWFPSESSPIDEQTALSILSLGMRDSTPEQIDSAMRMMRVPGIATLTEAIGQLAPSVVAATPVAIVDSPALFAPTRDGNVAVFATITQKPFPIGAETRALWRRMAIHLAAASRLVGRDDGADAEDVEVVLASGRVVHAVGDGTDAHARELATEGAARMDRARQKSVRRDAVHALELWHGLVAGRWSLVDHFDSDGRRFILARKNAPDVPAPAALSLQERRVVLYASAGWSLKEMAYALGVTNSTVSGHLSSALDKLGIASRAELVRLSNEISKNALAD